MYCENCGKEMTTGSAVCQNCGTVNKAKSGAPVNKGVFTIIAGVISAIAIALLVINSFSVNSSPEKVVKTMVRAMYEADAKEYAKCYADYWLQDLVYQLDLSRDASRKEITDALVGSWRFEEPIKITIKSCKEIARYDKADYRIYYKEEGMSEEDYAEVTEFAKVQITYIVNESREEETTYVCVKLSGKWYVM